MMTAKEYDDDLKLNCYILILLIYLGSASGQNSCFTRSNCEAVTRIFFSGVSLSGKFSSIQTLYAKPVR